MCRMFRYGVLDDFWWFFMLYNCCIVGGRNLNFKSWMLILVNNYNILYWVYEKSFGIFICWKSMGLRYKISD